jgi:hypothetical protein
MLSKKFEPFLVSAKLTQPSAHPVNAVQMLYAMDQEFL